MVALGTDYNILMIARLREEAREGESSRDAAAEAIKHAGPTVAAAGVILAGTFASLMLGGNALLIAMGFSISFGIFVAAFVMAMFFTPSLTALLGTRRLVARPQRREGVRWSSSRAVWRRQPTSSSTSRWCQKRCRLAGAGCITPRCRGWRRRTSGTASSGHSSTTKISSSVP